VNNAAEELKNVKKALLTASGLIPFFSFSLLPTGNN
jgi:hypothetical protein